MIKSAVPVVAIFILITAHVLTGDCRGEEARPSDYRLVWADEFDRPGRPDPKNWTFEQGFVRNEERQWYQAENAWCADGLLVIEARREQRPNPEYSPTSGDWKRRRPWAEYTSACLKTKGLHQWTYGRFEMRGRIDTRAGLWPAFWTLGAARSWPGCGEVDVMECYRGMLLANLIWAGGEGGRSRGISVRKPLAELGGQAWTRAFHVWRMDWDQERIEIYLDGQKLNSVGLNGTANRNAQAANPYREPHYLLLNLAVGGNQGGGPQGGERLPGGDPTTTTFPARFEVDYVRVYQKVD